MILVLQILDVERRVGKSPGLGRSMGMDVFRPSPRRRGLFVCVNETDPVTVPVGPSPPAWHSTLAGPGPTSVQELRAPLSFLKIPRSDLVEKEILMPPEKPETDGFLAMIEAKIAALKALADTYRAAVALGAFGQPGDIDVAQVATATPTGPKGGPIELPQGALLGMSIPSAVKLYLSAARRKLTTREIATGLKEGGVESTSRSFDNTVATALHRLKAAGDVLKFNDGWALAEFYPENLRSRLAAQGEQKAPKKAAKTRKRTAKKQARVLSLPAAEEAKAATG